MSGTNYTPPSVSTNIKSAAAPFMAAVKNNLPAIKAAMVKQGINAAGVKNLYLKPQTISTIIDKTIVAPTQAAEGGWGDHPSDPGGPTMRGVILLTFRGLFDTIFINTGVPPVVKAAKTFKNAGWYTGNQGSSGWELGKQALYVVNGDHDIASLFIHALASMGANRYPAAIMASDPYLGYVMHQLAWASGQGYFDQYNMTKILSKIGYKGGTQSVAAAVNLAVQFDGQNLTKDDTLACSLDSIMAFINWILRNTQPGSELSIFRRGWLNKAALNPQISILHNIVNMVQVFENGTCTTDPKEQAFLLAKAKLYRQVKVQIPNT